MKVIYREHEVEVKREASNAGYELLYCSIFRLSDGYECMSSIEDSGETVREMIGHLKERIDAELAESDPWMEKAKGH